MSNAISKVAKPFRRSKSPEVSAPWSWIHGLIGTVVSFYGSQQIASLLIGVYIGLQGWSDQQTDNWISGTSAQFVYTVIVEAFTLAIIWLFIRKYGWTAIKAGLGLRKIRWSDMGYMLVAFIVYYWLYITLLTVSSALFPIDTNQEQDIGFEQAKSFLPLALTFISLVILPPIIEEIVFRGFLFGGLRKAFSPVVAALITSVIFALPHSLQSTDGSTLWNAAIDTFALSLVLCYLRVKTGALWAGIGLHAIKNLIAFLAIFVFHVQ